MSLKCAMAPVSKPIRSTVGARLRRQTRSNKVQLQPVFDVGHSRATVCFTTGNESTIGGDRAALPVAEIAKAERKLRL